MWSVFSGDQTQRSRRAEQLSDQKQRGYQMIDIRLIELEKHFDVEWADLDALQTCRCSLHRRICCDSVT